MTHTPGPWRLARRGNGRGELPIIGPNGEIGCLRGAGSLDDGHLLAASPKLLEALEAAHNAMIELASTAGDVDIWNEGGEAYEAHEKIRAAIAKARVN